jgi:hypothetical protein
MDIQQNLALRQNDFQAYVAAREARRAGRVAELQQATPTAEVQEMTEAERAEAAAYLNGSLTGVSTLSEARYPQDISGIFPFPMDDWRIYCATIPRENDNDEALKVKKEYRDLNTEIKKDLNYAMMLEKKLGEGTHELTDRNGKKIADVKITKDRSGNVSVSIMKPDGSSTVVTYNEQKPGECRIEKTNKNGEKESLEKKGSTLSRTKNDVTEKYSIDEEGRPVKEKSGPGADDREKIVVNPDGSTDDYTLVYLDENGEPVYEHSHKDPKETKYQDAGAGKAIEALMKENPKGEITGAQMEKLIIDATKDIDNQAAGKEYEDLKKFVKANENRLSPDAKAKWEVYEKYVEEARKKGQTGIDQADYEKMKKEMHQAHYEDKGAGKAIEALKEENPKGEIDAGQMYKLVVDATEDPDNQAAGKEYDDLKKYVEQNWNRLSKDAKATWEIYENYAREARAKGETGIKGEDYQKMLREMKAVG